MLSTVNTSKNKDIGDRKIKFGYLTRLNTEQRQEHNVHRINNN